MAEHRSRVFLDVYSSPSSLLSASRYLQPPSSTSPTSTRRAAFAHIKVSTRLPSPPPAALNCVMQDAALRQAGEAEGRWAEDDGGGDEGEGPADTVTTAPKSAIPAVAPPLPDRTIYRYQLSLPFIRLAHAISGNNGATQSSIQNRASLRQLTIHPPTLASPLVPLQLNGTRASIQEGLRLIKHVLMVDFYGQWQPAEWRALCGLANAATWDILYENRLVPLAVPLAETDSFGRVVRPHPSTALPPAGPSSSSSAFHRDFSSSSSSAANPPPPSQPAALASSLLHRVGPANPSPFNSDEPPLSPFSPSPSPPARRVPSFSRSPSPRHHCRPSPTPPPPPPPQDRLIRYVLYLPFRSLSSAIIGRGGHNHRRIRRKCNLLVFSCQDTHAPEGQGKNLVELVGSRGWVRKALEEIEEVVYGDKGQWTADEWRDLADIRWLDFEGWKCEEVDEERRRRLEAAKAARRPSRSPSPRYRRRSGTRERKYRFSRILPFKKLVEYIDGVRGATAARIRRRSELVSLEFSFTRGTVDGVPASLVLVGTKKAIKSALREVEELVVGELREVWNGWEWGKLRDGEWARFDERGCRPLDGGWSEDDRDDDDRWASMRRGRSRKRSREYGGGRRSRSPSPTRKRDRESSSPRRFYSPSRWRSPRRQRRKTRDSGVALPDEELKREEEKPSCEVPIPSSVAHHFLATSPTALSLSSTTGRSLALSSSSTHGTVVQIEGKSWEDVEAAKREVERVVEREEKKGASG